MRQSNVSEFCIIACGPLKKKNMLLLCKTDYLWYVSVLNKG